MKIAVLGIGGVGGYMAGMLGKTDSTLTLVARGARKEALQKEGLTLHSDLNGEIKVKPDRVVSTDEVGEQDIIFLTVKTFGLEQACDEIRDKITDSTIIVPVMNGVDTSDRVRKALGKGIVIDSVIYIVTFLNADYSITQQGAFATVKYGIKKKGVLSDEETEALDKVTKLFKEAGLDSELSKDIEADIWKKYVLNSAFNVETAYYDNTIGELQADKVKSEEYEELVRESYRVAKAKGVNLTDADVDEVIKKFYAYGPELTSSLQRDLRDGKNTELEIFGGYLVREAKANNVEVPISERMYEGIKRR